MKYRHSCLIHDLLYEDRCPECVRDSYRQKDELEQQVADLTAKVERLLMAIRNVQVAFTDPFDAESWVDGLTADQMAAIDALLVAGEAL